MPEKYGNKIGERGTYSKRPAARLREEPIAVGEGNKPIAHGKKKEKTKWAISRGFRGLTEKSDRKKLKKVRKGRQGPRNGKKRESKGKKKEKGQAKE